jgi:hypothetical protein
MKAATLTFQYRTPSIPGRPPILFTARPQAAPIQSCTAASSLQSRHPQISKDFLPMDLVDPQGRYLPHT